MTGWHANATVAELLASHSATLAELRSRGVVRTNNAPAGDYAEWLVARALGATIVDNKSARSYDLALPDGRRIQVKARVVSQPTVAGQTTTSVFRSFDFELAALVLLHERDYRPMLAVIAPVDVVQAHAKWRGHVNGSVVHIRPPLTIAAGVEDITGLLAAAVD